MLSDSAQAIRRVAERLAELNGRMVFLGGATLGLLITEPGAPAPRPTRDVDLIVEITMLEYLNNALRTQRSRSAIRASSIDLTNLLRRLRLAKKTRRPCEARSRRPRSHSVTSSADCATQPGLSHSTRSASFPKLPNPSGIPEAWNTLPGPRFTTSPVWLRKIPKSWPGCMNGRTIRSIGVPT